MTDIAAEMLDMVFDVSGDTLPADYPFALWDELVKHAPALATDESVGVLPLRTSPSEAGMLLPKRAKLALRLPASLAGHAAILSGKELDLGTGMLRLGASKLRAIQPHCTLHAHLVSTDAGEVEFIESISVRLNELGVSGKLICGLHGRMTASDRTIQGYSLVIHDLKPDASLRLQYTGLGADRRFGCGIFLPHKAISDLD